MDRKNELIDAMLELDDRYDAGEMTRVERNDRIIPLNDEYKQLVGHYFVSGRYVVENFGLSVHHDRAYLHQR